MDLSTQDAEAVTLLPPTIKGNADWRQFRSFQLANGVRCTVVHDQESKTLAAAAITDTGAGADPRSMPGVAHFVEHCLFLGSEKYPDENGYKSFLAAHGGRSNASTSLHTTTYKFEILAEFGEQALDRFAQFFVAPLFTASGTGREVQAVDSENSKNLTADNRRRLQILKTLADPNHYYSKFTTGNSVTLPTADEPQLEQLRATLLAFHKKHYTPDSLVVVVAGPQSLEELQDYVVSKFSPLRAQDFPTDVSKMTPAEQVVHEAALDLPNYAYYLPVPPYQPAFQSTLQTEYGGWPVLLVTNPLRSMRKLSLMFQVPSGRKNPDRSPIHVLSHLLGHEGPGSAFAVLQNHGLLSSLVAGPRSSGPDFCLFYVEMNLTEQGEAQWQQVADIIFAHCRLIYQAALTAQQQQQSTATNGGTTETDLHQIWGEVAALRKIFFDQSSPGGVYDFAPNLVNSILVNGPEECMSSGNMLQESVDTLPLDDIVEFASLLVPSNCIVERCSNDAWDEMEKQSTNNDDASSTATVANVQKHKEPWYGIDYYLAKINPNQVRHWENDKKDSGMARIDHGQLHLPKKNRYIPRSLELCPELPEEAKAGARIEKEIDPPKLLVDNDMGRLWHRLDDRYALPKSSLTFLWRNAAVENIVGQDGVWDYSLSSSVHSSLLSGMFAEHMAQETYDAELAGLYWSLSMTSSGLKLTCNGFSDRLADLALTVLDEFVSGRFVQDVYLTNAKDRVIRNLSTFFQARRSDSIAVYYRDLLIAANELGIDSSLEAAKTLSLDSALEHHKELIRNSQVSLECLYSGNVSATDAGDFFTEASKLVSEGQMGSTQNLLETGAWTPGPLEYQFPTGDTELHFSSNNPNEENGAVVVTYQSSIPGFKGEKMSTPESLHSSASIRLLSHILREPLFDELRTKQQLGYIVHSYHDIAFSSPEPRHVGTNDPLTTPVDCIVVNVLSKKVAPSEVAQRIDAFMDDFRSSLENTPESEIADHAKALKTKLLKPIQKLGSETSNHFGKIRRYSPEILKSGGSDHDLPWDNAKVMAGAIEKLKRKDLVKTWDRLVQRKSRSRVVSHVYGSTFPLATDASKTSSSRKIVDSVPDLVKLRGKLNRYGDVGKSNGLTSQILSRLAANKTYTGAAAVALLGVGYIGFSMINRSKRTGK